MYNISNPVDAAFIYGAIDSGVTVACSSESVWGLSCDPYNYKAVTSICDKKGRASEKPFVLTISNIKQISFLLDGLPSELRSKIYNYWPGYYTLVIPDPLNRMPPWVKGNKNSIAIRLTNHQPLAMLSDLWGGALVSSSANISGEKPFSDYKQVYKCFGNHTPIIKGEPGTHMSVSPIINIINGSKLR